MDALQKTLTLLLLIGLGLLLRHKFQNREHVNGIKEMVLSVALPATIFIALMKIQLDISLLVVPVAALAFNFLMYFLMPVALPLFGIEKNSATGRTLTMLVPSLAPGLSCFPFVAEFLGEESLAMAAMADVGNKFFVLIFLYMVALNMFISNNRQQKTDSSEKLKSLLLNLVKEPINIMLMLAVLLLALGVSYKTMPTFLTELLDKTSAMMTPLVLLFIGLAVQLKDGKKRLIVSVLCFRAGVSLLFSALLIGLLGISTPPLMLLAVVLPLSSASFWPFAHIAAFNLKEEQAGTSRERRTFDSNFAVLVLAFSLPFSTLLILAILSAGNFFADTLVLIAGGLLLVTFGIVPQWIGKVMFKRTKVEAVP